MALRQNMAIKIFKIQLVNRGREASRIFNGLSRDNIELKMTDHKLAVRVAEEFRPDLVIIEENASGTELKSVCMGIRSLSLARRPTIVIISPDGDDDHVSNALISGADDYIKKPISKMQLLARINAHLAHSNYWTNLLQDKKNIETIFDITKAASSTLNANEILQTIVSKLAEITNAERCSILLVSDADKGYVLASSDSPGIKDLAIDLHKYPEIKEALRTKNLLMIENMPSHPIMMEVKELLSEFEGMSILVVPITFGEDALGALFLRAHKKGFEEKEIELCRIAATAAYPALRNARRYERLKKEKEALLRKQIEFLAKNKMELIAINKALNKEMGERRKVEEAIKTQSQLINSIIDNSTALIYVKDIEGRYLLANKQFLNYFNTDIKTTLGSTDFMLFPEKIAKVYRANDLKVLETKIALEFEEVAPHEDGPHTYISVKFPLYRPSGEIYAICGISTDITIHKYLEEERIKAQKLESVGVLAGGIAHDFNNILTGILANISFVKEFMDKKAAHYKRFADLEKAIFRAKALTYQLLTFSRGGKPIKETTYIRELLKECVDFSTRGSSLKCAFNIVDDLWPVEADIGQISQVINNLVINARQAMPEGGLLKISACNLEQDDLKKMVPEEVRYVKISIEDQGIGIPEEYLNKIFDPYFTTKQKGNGLGLASVYTIIKNHNGLIDVKSQVGKGTIFNIYLPVSNNDVVRKLDGTEPILAGCGRILVMDDEEMIRDVIDCILSDRGYSVSFATNGEEALDIYKSSLRAEKPIDAVILDLTIRGGMGGKETVRRLLEIDPKAKIIASSGYHNDPMMSDYLKYGFKGIIPKPYRATDLVKILNNVIQIQQ